MSRTISVSGVPKRVFRFLVAAFAVCSGLVFGGQALLVALDAVGIAVAYPDGFVGLAIFGVLWVGLTGLWLWRSRGWEGSGSMWGPIPTEQYAGRFAELGGIARYDWEKAIERLPDDENSER
ncbi:hypothetical protein OB920_08555 [Halobacteria archaeon HArc-gm2]|nr:hypothetical protein [Halobacteria archaeon HArc-gm2]